MASIVRVNASVLNDLNESEMLMFNNGNWNAKDQEIHPDLILWQMKKEAEI